MRLSTVITVLIIIVVRAAVWMHATERRTEKTFSSEGIQGRVLEAAAKGGITKIVEPNGDAPEATQEICNPSHVVRIPRSRHVTSLETSSEGQKARI